MEKITKHRQRLGKWVTQEKMEESRLIRTEHKHLEDEIAGFVKAFRKQRKETFRITEYVVDVEKLSGYLKSLTLPLAGKQWKTFVYESP